MHRCSVFKNSCINVPIDPISKMPKTAYERVEKNNTDEYSIESSTCSVIGTDFEAEKLKDFYRSIPEYNDINHLSESEFYSTLKRLREKKKLMLGLAVEHIDDCKIYNDKICFISEKDNNPKKDFQLLRANKISESGNCKTRIFSRNSKRMKSPTRKGVRKSSITDEKAICIADENKLGTGLTKTSALVVKGTSKVDRSNRNQSACSISWHDDKLDGKTNEVDEKFCQDFEGNETVIDDDYLHKTQSMPSSPLRTRRTGSGLRRRQKSITVPKPFKMTERDEENRIVNELRSLQKSFSEDLLNQKKERKRFRAKNVPIESRIPLYDKILEDQAMRLEPYVLNDIHIYRGTYGLPKKSLGLLTRRAITKINSEAELRAQMKPFSFTKKEEGSVGSICERAANILPKSKKRKRFKARPIPKNLFSNYFYNKITEDNFFRSMNRRIRAEEMLRNSSLPGKNAMRDRSRLSTPAAHSDLPIDPSPVVPSISSSDRQRSISPTKNKRKTNKLKDDFVTTSPQPFRFNTAERASKKINEISRKIYQDSKSSDSGDIQKIEEDFNKTEAYTALDLKGVAAGRSNLAALLRAEAVRRKFELEAARNLQEQRKRAETKHRDRILRANPAWHLIKNNHEEDIAIRLQTRRDEERMRREEFLHEMELMYGRVQQQPMLFERYYAPRSGATTVDSIQLSPRKSPKKRNLRKKKSYHFPSPSISPELHGHLLKYMDKNVDRYGTIDSLDRD